MDHTILFHVLDPVPHQVCIESKVLGNGLVGLPGSFFELLKYPFIFVV